MSKLEKLSIVISILAIAASAYVTLAMRHGWPL